MRTLPHRFAPVTLVGLILSSAAVLAPAAAPAAAATTCRGAVVRPVDAPTLRRAPLRLCITVGGLVRVERLGPGLLAATPARRVECNYEAGVHQCRLIRTGRVTLTLRDGTARRVVVTVVRAARPTKPAPACRSGRTVLRLDAVDDGPAWWAECLKLGATVRIANLGPGRLTVTPRRAVRCRYEAAVHACRLRAPATVTFVARTARENRRLTVVAVR